MRKWCSWLAVAALAGVGVGCGSSDNDGSATTASIASGASLDESCSGGKASGTLTVYSGRSETLVDDFFTLFSTETGIDVDVRYGDTGELAGQILTEGSATPADIFFSQDAGALGALASAGLLSGLPDELLSRVGNGYRSTSGEWVGTSGRVRVIVYNSELVSNPPTKIDELLDPMWKGKIGFAPTNASWQSFVTALRVIRGDDEARQWLEGFAANDPVPFEKNAVVRDAVNAGQVEIGLVNHYYLYELIATAGEDAVVARNQFMAGGDVGGLVNVAGMALLGNSADKEIAKCLIWFALSDAGQAYFAERTYEYPLVSGVEQFAGLPALSDLNSPSLDLSDLQSLAATQEMLSSVGLLTE